MTYKLWLRWAHCTCAVLTRLALASVLLSFVRNKRKVAMGSTCWAAGKDDAKVLVVS